MKKTIIATAALAATMLSTVALAANTAPQHMAIPEAGKVVVTKTVTQTVEPMHMRHHQGPFFYPARVEFRPHGQVVVWQHVMHMKHKMPKKVFNVNAKCHFVEHQGHAWRICMLP